MITTVIFDVANVVVDWDASRALRGVVDDAQVEEFLGSRAFWDINAATDAGLPLADAQARVDAELPRLSPVVRTYFERFPLTVSGPVPGTSEIIGELLDAGVPTFGLSNWSAENFHVARAAAPVLGRLDDLMVSGEVGLAKPDAAIFELALDRFGVDAATTLFVDDSLPNIETARALALATHHFTTADLLRADLVERGLLPAA